MPGYSKWRDIAHARDDQYRYTLRRQWRPWWGLGLVTRFVEIQITRPRTDDEAEVLRSLAELKAEFPDWSITRSDSATT